MTTTNAITEGVPSFWKKWWNALTKCIKRDGSCSGSSKRQPDSKTEEYKAEEGKAV